MYSAYRSTRRGRGEVKGVCLSIETSDKHCFLPPRQSSSPRTLEFKGDMNNDIPGFLFGFPSSISTWDTSGLASYFREIVSA